MTRRIARVFICFLIGLSMLGQIAPCAASEGGFDPTFANGGRQLVGVSALGQYDAAVRMILRPDGRVLLGGTCTYASSSSTENTFCVTQLLANGSYDGSFGPAGVGYLEFDRFASWPQNTGLRDMIILQDGRIALFGNNLSGNTLLLAVLKADGSGLDTSVGAGSGYLLPKFSNRSSPAYSMVQQPDGKLLIAGATLGANNNFDFAVERLLGDLSGPDTSFGSAGVQTVAFDLGGPTGDDGDFCEAVLMQSDGRIVLVGYATSNTAAQTSTTEEIALSRLNTDGSRDLSFGTAGDGRLHYSAGKAIATAMDAKIDAANRIVLGGSVIATGASSSQWIIDRLTADGARDVTFNTGNPQIFSPPLGNGGSARRVALTNDGIFAIGDTLRMPSATPSYFAVARLNIHGVLDTRFGNAGLSYGSFTATNDTDADGRGIAVAKGGLLVLGTQTQSSGSSDTVMFGLGRLQYDCVFRSIVTGDFGKA